MIVCFVTVQDHVRLVYLKVPSVTSQLVGQSELALVTSFDESPIPLSVFANSGTAALLFEGVAPGQAALTVYMYKNGVKMGEDNVYLDLKPIANMYDHWTVGPTDAPSAMPTELKQIGFAAPVAGRTSDYIVFVHGWRMQPWERLAYAETAFKRLWHEGYKGGFALFSWPTEWFDGELKLENITQLQNYDDSENKAWLSATGLHELLGNLQVDHPGHVYMFAHSMGNIVASEALRIEAETLTPTKLVHVYVASQAASVANAYDQNVPAYKPRPLPDFYGYFPPTGKPYFSGTRNTKSSGGLRRAADVLVNFYNPQDYALTNFKVWPLNQRTKPDRGWQYFPFWIGPHGVTPAGYYRTIPFPEVLLNYQKDRYEIFSHAAPAYTSALGATTNVGGPFTSQVDLNAQFNFGGLQANSHSAQFIDTMAMRAPYWDTLLRTFGLK